MLKLKDCTPHPLSYPDPIYSFLRHWYNHKTYRDLLWATVNGDAFLHLNMKNNLHEHIKTLTNDHLLLNQSRVANQLLKPPMFLMTLGYTNKPRTYQVLYYVYKNDDHMD